MEPSLVVLGEPTGLTIGTGQDGWVAVDIDVRGSDGGIVHGAADDVFRRLKGHLERLDVAETQEIAKVEQPRPGSPGQGRSETIRFWRRLFPGDSAENVLAWLEGPVLDGAGETDAVSLDVQIHEQEQRLYTGHSRRVRLAVPSWSTDLAHPVVERARESMIAAGCPWHPTRWRMGRWGMGTAGAVVTREFSLPTIGFGPGDETEAHECNESVSIAGLVEAVFGTAVLMRGMSAAPSVLPLDVIRTDEARRAAGVPKGDSTRRRPEISPGRQKTSGPKPADSWS